MFARTSWRGYVVLRKKLGGAGNSVPCRGQSETGNPRACSACLFAQGRVVFGSTYLQYAIALTPCPAQKSFAAQPRELPALLWGSAPNVSPTCAERAAASQLHRSTHFKKLANRSRSSRRSGFFSPQRPFARMFSRPAGKHRTAAKFTAPSAVKKSVSALKSKDTLDFAGGVCYTVTWRILPCVSMQYGRKSHEFQHGKNFQQQGKTPPRT